MTNSSTYSYSSTNSISRSANVTFAIHSQLVARREWMAGDDR